MATHAGNPVAIQQTLEGVGTKVYTNCRHIRPLHDEKGYVVSAWPFRPRWNPKSPRGPSLPHMQVGTAEIFRLLEDKRVGSVTAYRFERHEGVPQTSVWGDSRWLVRKPTWESAHAFAHELLEEAGK